MLENARAQAEEAGEPAMVALVAVNDPWSVYAVGPTFLAVAVLDGETISLASLGADDLDELAIPWPE